MTTLAPNEKRAVYFDRFWQILTDWFSTNTSVKKHGNRSDPISADPISPFPNTCTYCTNGVAIHFCPTDNETTTNTTTTTNTNTTTTNNNNNKHNTTGNDNGIAIRVCPTASAPGLRCRRFTESVLLQPWAVPFIPMPMPKPVCRTNCITK